MQQLGDFRKDDPFTPLSPAVPGGDSREEEPPLAVPHLLAVYPCAAEPAIVFCCLLSDGKQVPAVPDRSPKSPGLGATGTGPAVPLLSSQSIPSKDSSLPPPAWGLILSSLIELGDKARESRAKRPAQSAVLCREGRGKPMAPPRLGWEQGKGLSLLSLCLDTVGMCPSCPCAWTQQCPHSGDVSLCPSCLDTAMSPQWGHVPPFPVPGHSSVPTVGTCPCVPVPGHSGSVGHAGAAVASFCPHSAPGCLERGSRAS